MWGGARVGKVGVYAQLQQQTQVLCAVMELLQVLTLVLLAGGIAAQGMTASMHQIATLTGCFVLSISLGIPVFEPLSSSEGIAVLVDERSSQGMLCTLQLSWR